MREMAIILIIVLSIAADPVARVLASESKGGSMAADIPNRGLLSGHIQLVDGSSHGSDQQRISDTFDRRGDPDPFDRRGDPNPFDRRIDPSRKQPPGPRHFDRFQIPRFSYPPGSYIIPQPDMDVYFAYVDHGLAVGSQGFRDAAINDFSNAIALRPDLGLAYYYRSQVWLQVGRQYEAVQDARIAAGLEPGNSIFRDWYFHLSGR